MVQQNSHDDRDQTKSFTKASIRVIAVLKTEIRMLNIASVGP